MFLALLASRIFWQMKLVPLAVTSIYRDVRDSRYSKIDLPQMTGRVAIVTGGSRGIGFEVVRMLLRCDMEVIIACRNVAAGLTAVNRIRESGVKDGKAQVYQLDNASLDSVRKFVDNIKSDYAKIDILINNAGLMFPPYRETPDGFEEQWEINYLSHFLLTALLMPLLRAAGSSTSYSRVINVSSSAHYQGSINFDDTNYKNRWVTPAAYAQSKLALVMFTKTLQQIFHRDKLNMRTYSVDPGVVQTGLQQYTPYKHLKFVTKRVFKTPIEGATPIVYAALSEDIKEKGGIYISNCLESPVNPLANDDELRDRLFNLSLRQTRLKNFFE